MKIINWIQDNLTDLGLAVPNEIIGVILIAIILILLLILWRFISGSNILIEGKVFNWKIRISYPFPTKTDE